MRREWRRTSSSQAEASPWRHCWTSWASCSNVSSASNPGTVTCATTSGQFVVNRRQPCSACHTMERKVPPKCSLRHLTPRPESNGRILLTGRRKHKKCRKNEQLPGNGRESPSRSQTRRAAGARKFGECPPFDAIRDYWGGAH